ncbi:hypothetical protein L227DRAFT_66460 [Lentinus tigrinus ALCF2SS1-6]|uniref:Uncharacterized protein n=1 Tax=Lentinus tigrinus ALCF2SS1-6 TaxID=1328759 RepID=A0A5C2SDJ3_9APHY|nr:hypothetical protein L227DRAFT_66460 [Lentinus tigrinus ALCF2SS1-6]
MRAGSPRSPATSAQYPVPARPRMGSYDARYGRRGKRGTATTGRRPSRAIRRRLWSPVSSFVARGSWFVVRESEGGDGDGEVGGWVGASPVCVFGRSCLYPFRGVGLWISDGRLMEAWDDGKQEEPHHSAPRRSPPWTGGRGEDIGRREEAPWALPTSATGRGEGRGRGRGQGARAVDDAHIEGGEKNVRGDGGEEEGD